MRKLLILTFCTPLALLAQSIDTTRQVKFLALGDSYTIGQGVIASERWPMQLATKTYQELVALTNEIRS